VLLLVSHPGPAGTGGSWQIQTPLTGCGCASTQRQSAGAQTAGRSSGGTGLLAAAQHAGPYHLEVVRRGCPLFTQLSRVQLIGSFCSFRLKVVHEATLGRGSLIQLISVYSVWVIAHTPQQRVSSLLDTLTAANRKKPARGASEEKSSSAAWIHHLREPLSLLWL